MIGIVRSVGWSLLTALVTETVIKKVVIFGLRWVAKKTKNTDDDKLVEIIIEAWKKKP